MAKGWRKSKKPGTKNKEQAAARDERAAAAAVAAEAADRAAAAELLADLATQEEPPITSPCMVVKPQPQAAGQRARWRAMIIWKYVELGRPSSKRWRGRGGTLAVISRWLEQHEDADKRPIENVRRRPWQAGRCARWRWRERRRRAGGWQAGWSSGLTPLCTAHAHAVRAGDGAHAHMRCMPCVLW